jgi:hypothetical protein
VAQSVCCTVLVCRLKKCVARPAGSQMGKAEVYVVVLHAFTTRGTVCDLGGARGYRTEQFEAILLGHTR